MSKENRNNESELQDLSQERREEIAHALEEKGADQPCPRCGTTSFAVLDGYFVHGITSDMTTHPLGGKSLPTAVIICANCGFLSEHALGSLGMLGKTEED